MKRKIISIDESLCNGCSLCVEGCHEGALQMIDGKARLVSELYCDGLGACIGECPVGVITIEEREAEPYDEYAVMERISAKGEKTIVAHLKHLKDHNETNYLSQAFEYIKKHQLDIDISAIEHPKPKSSCGCLGSMSQSFASSFASKAPISPSPTQSQLTHWPVQLHLLNPMSEHFLGADVVLAADCTAFAYPDFHTKLLKNKKLAIGCPKLDSNKEVYIDKIATMIDAANINTLTVVIMQVPCCNGLTQLAKIAVEKAERKIPIKQIVIGLKGEIMNEKWL